MSQAIVYGPRKYQGLNLQDIYIKQHIDKVMMWLNKQCTRGLGNKLLNHSCQVLQLETGLENNFLEYVYDYSRLEKMVTKTWVTDIWSFLNSHQITLNGPMTLLKKETQ